MGVPGSPQSTPVVENKIETHKWRFLYLNHQGYKQKQMGCTFYGKCLVQLMTNGNEIETMLLSFATESLSMVSKTLYIEQHARNRHNFKVLAYNSS